MLLYQYTTKQFSEDERKEKIANKLVTLHVTNRHTPIPAKVGIWQGFYYSKFFCTFLNQVLIFQYG
jgi:hypothetical protein